MVFIQGDNDQRNFEKIIDSIKESRKGKTLGVFSKDFEKFPGAFITAFRTAIENSKFERVDMSGAFAVIMAPRYILQNYEPINVYTKLRICPLMQKLIL